MIIEILGTGCAKCKATEKVVREAVDELEIQAEIAKVEDFQEIVDRGVMITPAVVVKDDVKYNCANLFNLDNKPHRYYL
jgi:small redox-active disulfide protein 2